MRRFESIAIVADIDPFARFLLMLAAILLASLLAFLFLIARFYERKARENVFARLFLVVAALFLLAGARYAFFAESFIGDAAGDALLLLAGVSALALNYNLTAVLMRRRQ